MSAILSEIIENKERPILFSGEMVRAILSGRKTQTRRIVKNDQAQADATWCFRCTCPFGKPGDRLWVREAWRARERYDRKPNCGPNPGSHIIYEADAPHEEGLDIGRLRPSIHMPRWASRIMLEITAVRVERLHDISEEDAKAEGCQNYGEKFNLPKNGSVCWYARYAYMLLWDKINGAGSWAENPLVWVVEFRRV